LERGELVGDPFQRALPARGVAARLDRVAADDEAPPGLALADDHLLDLQVLGDGAVAARPGQRNGVGMAGAQLLADDEVPAGALQIAAVVLAAEAGVEHPDDAVQATLA